MGASRRPPLASITGMERAVAGTEQMAAQMAGKNGFIAALDQSGGSTPGALRQYGIADDVNRDENEMFGLIHAMRVRIITSPPFSGGKVIGAILFEGTMNGVVKGKPTPSYLWQDRGVVPFVKADKGLDAEIDGVRLMKPMPGLDELLKRATGLGVYGTKMRSVINGASRTGIAAIVKQQFEIARRIAAHGLMPIIEPEVSIKASDKTAAEEILNDEIHLRLDALDGNSNVMLKLTIPSTPDQYASLIGHARVQRVVALSGGYSRHEACRLLAMNHGMIASFSRALIDDLRASMSGAAFSAALRDAIDEIYRASVHKA
jgi:fructose-bisphosphate aldolase class I